MDEDQLSTTYPDSYSKNIFNSDLNLSTRNINYYSFLTEEDKEVDYSNRVDRSNLVVASRGYNIGRGR